MIVSLSLKSLFRRRSRTLLALAGIAVSAALLLDMTMLASGLTESFGELTRAQGYGLRVTPRGTLPFDSEAGIREGETVQREIEGVAGVRKVAPVLGAQLYLVLGDSARESLFTVGVDPAAQALYLLTSGEPPRPGEIVVSEPLARHYRVGVGDELALAADLDVSLGRPREVHAFRVSGVGDFLYDAADERSLAMPLPDVQRLTGRPGEVSLFAVAAGEGVDEEQLSARIERAVPQVSVYSTAELMVEMDQRLLYFRQLATILGSVALAVTALLVSTIIAIGVRERFGEIAALRAIGVSRPRLLLGVLVEGVTLAGAGCLLGLPLGLWMAGRLDRILLGFPGIPARLSFFVLDAERVGLALSIVVATGAIAGLLPGTGALRVPLGRALREEGE
jgi:putative ABC transport system permease protein